MLLGNNECYWFYWIPPCVTMSIYRTYIIGDLFIWNMVSNMILATSVLMIKSVLILHIIMTLLWHGKYILMIYIVTNILTSTYIWSFCCMNISCFCLIIYIIHWILIIIVRSITMLYKLINAVLYIYFSKKFLIGVLCWIPVLLVFLGHWVLTISRFTSNIYYMVFIGNL